MSEQLQEAFIEPLMDEALLLDFGSFKVLPEYDGKSPKVKGWQTREFSLDDIRKYLAIAKVPGIGVQMGPISGIIDIETDNEEQEQAVYDLFDGNIPTCPTFTSRKGKHRIFAWDDRFEEFGVANLNIPCGSGEPLIIRLGAGGKGSQSAFPPSPNKEWLPGQSIHELLPPALPEFVFKKLLAYVKKKTPAKTTTANDDAKITPAVASMLSRHEPDSEESDGSKRLLSVCCRGVELDLSDEQLIAAVRKYEESAPFPVNWTDQQILNRVRDAERREDCERGSAIEQPTYNLTDSGNAERFAHQHRLIARYSHHWGQWIIYFCGRWVIDQNGAVFRLAKATNRTLHEEAAKLSDKADREAMWKYANISESRSKIEAMVALARHAEQMKIDYREFNRDPYLLNCKNGTLDLRTGELREHRREDFLTKMLNVEYPSSAAGGQLWLKFLAEIFDGDQELIGFLRRLMGYALIGEVKEHVFPVFHGSGANGKSTFTSIITEILGEYAMTLNQEYLMESKNKRHSTEVMDLYGVRLAVAKETEEGARLNEARVKSQTGGDMMRGRRLYQESWEFPPSHLFILETNHRPYISGTDHGIWRRVKLVPFTVQIPPEKQDPYLLDKLRQIKPAILHWMVQGCLEWQRQGLAVPEKVAIATTRYRDESDLFGDFINECCERDPDKEIRASHLYAAYSQRAKDRGEFPQSMKRISERMEAMKFPRVKKNIGLVYRGITLRPTHDMSEFEELA